jgi:hypothetical protein
MGMPLVYLAVSAALGVLAILGRWRQVPVGRLSFMRKE